MNIKITLKHFKQYYTNSKEIVLKYNIQSDEELNTFFDEYVDTKLGCNSHDNIYTELVYINHMQKYVSIDIGLASIINILNNGYNLKTHACCWGHKIGKTGYISFQQPLPVNLTQLILKHMWGMGYYVMLQNFYEYDNPYVDSGYKNPVIRWVNKGNNNSKTKENKLTKAFINAFMEYERHL